MRCPVCGKRQQFHKMACWTLRRNGKNHDLILHRRSRCSAIQIFQTALINASLSGEPQTLHKVRNCPDCQPFLVTPTEV